MFRLAYNTNGLAHHRPLEALELLSDLGYEGVALTPDVGPLDPYDLSRRLVAELRARAADLGLELVVETGARYLLDARRKHWPTLLELDATERSRRVDFLRRAIDLAVGLDAGIVSLWSGSEPSGLSAEAGPSGPDAARRAADRERAWDRLCSGLSILIDDARGAGVRLAFEPEPGMFIERPSGYGELLERLGGAGQDLGLTLDVGHLIVSGDLPVEAHIRRWAERLVHVHLDDARRGVHEHLMFGRGELDLPAVLHALIEVGFCGQAAVELSRDGHRGPQAAEEALQRLRRALQESSSEGA